MAFGVEKALQQFAFKWGDALASLLVRSITSLTPGTVNTGATSPKWELNSPPTTASKPVTFVLYTNENCCISTQFSTEPSL